MTNMKPFLGFAMCAVTAFAMDTYACSCPWQGPFVEVSGKAQLTATVRVEGYGPKLDHGTNLYEFMEVTVLDVLSGKEEAKTLRIYGDTGNLCRPYISTERFTPGAEYVLAIDRLSRASNYKISICGEHWISRLDDKVSGRITSNQSETMSYEALRNALAKRGKSER